MTPRHVRSLNDAELKGHAGMLSMVNLSGLVEFWKILIREVLGA
jgi:hypothetical protein